MRTKFLLLLLISGFLGHAQEQAYDIFKFIPPKGWKKNMQQNFIGFSTTDNVKKTWAQVGIIKSTVSKGSIEADFESEWKNLVVNPYQEYGVTQEPLGLDTQTVHHWKLWTGLGRFVFNKDTSMILLHTFSDGQRCASITIMSNTTSYGAALDQFIASINLTTPEPSATKNEVVPPAPTPSTPVATGFQFNTTNFDDGWTSVVKEDWVEATKGNIKVLLHYPREEEKKYYSQYDEHVRVFWNLLVAPRYTNLRDYQSPTHLLAWQPGLFAAGLLTDKATSKDVWVALFSKAKSGWIEIITPDKKTFVDNFGVDQPELYFDEWDRLLKLTGLNRFAVGEQDLTGKWSNDFFGSNSYYSVYTGLYAGSTTFTSRVSFTFHKNKTYNWDLVMAQGATGSLTKVDQAKASGTWKLLNNWQIWLSEIERKPRTYNAYFSCIKGGRILWLQDQSYGDYEAHGMVSK